MKRTAFALLLVTLAGCDPWKLTPDPQTQQQLQDARKGVAQVEAALRASEENLSELSDKWNSTSKLAKKLKQARDEAIQQRQLAEEAKMLASSLASRLAIWNKKRLKWAAALEQTKQQLKAANETIAELKKIVAPRPTDFAS